MTHALRSAILLVSCVAATTSVAAPVRPPGATIGEIVAEVHLRIGAGSLVRAGGQEYAATPGTKLVASDELVVPPGQVLVVSLRNGYVVRLDDDINLRVAQIVLINAPKAKESLGSQLDRLLTKEEQGRAERIAGVHARVGGAMTSGIEQSSGDPSRAAAAPPPPSPPPAQVGSVRAHGAEDPAPRSEPVAEPVDARRETTKGKGTSKPMPSSDDEARESHSEKAAQIDKDAAPAKKKKQQSTALPKEAGLRTCLARELGKLPVPIAVAPLRLFLTGGKISRAALAGGLRLPACANKLLIGGRLDGEDGRWLDRELPLR